MTGCSVPDAHDSDETDNKPVVTLARCEDKVNVIYCDWDNVTEDWKNTDHMVFIDTSRTWEQTYQSR